MSHASPDDYKPGDDVPSDEPSELDLVYGDLHEAQATIDGLKNPSQAMIDRGADVMALHLFGYAKAMQSDREAFETALRAALATPPASR